MPGDERRRAHLQRFDRARRHRQLERARGRPRGPARRDLCARQGRQPAVDRLGAAGDARGALLRGQALGAQADRLQRLRQRRRRQRLQRRDRRRRQPGRTGRRPRFRLPTAASRRRLDGPTRSLRWARSSTASASLAARSGSLGAELRRDARRARAQGRDHHARRADAGRAVGRDRQLPRRRRVPDPGRRRAAADGGGNSHLRSSSSRSASASPSPRRCWPTA